MTDYKHKRPTFKKKTYKKSYRKSVVKKRMTKMVKQVVMKTMETKHIDVDWNKVETFHNIC